MREGGEADLVGHTGEGGDVTDLHAGVGGGLQHQQLGVALDQGLFNCPAIHEDNHMPAAFAETMSQGCVSCSSSCPHQRPL